MSIGQILLSIRCKEVNAVKAAEALRRAKFKFPGRQKIIASKNWGFTKFNAVDYELWKEEGRLIHDGINAKLLDNKGPLDARKPERLFLKPAKVLGIAQHEPEDA